MSKSMIKIFCFGDYCRPLIVDTGFVNGDMLNGYEQEDIEKELNKYIGKYESQDYELVSMTPIIQGTYIYEATRNPAKTGIFSSKDIASGGIALSMGITTGDTLHFKVDQIK